MTLTFVWVLATAIAADASAVTPNTPAWAVEAGTKSGLTITSSGAVTEAAALFRATVADT